MGEIITGQKPQGIRMGAKEKEYRGISIRLGGKKGSERAFTITTF